ncbi:hypothetical protein BV25DRAFT_1820809 [Artomyces pyxidatus]|uniref:Uncharacterized protein n=1 Tax=Artomyces pyxidatus TaxID=48021 RepID=A0ACB8TE75_9AGAM|nr:hypothetical protein BV25DRAFT_1820809 [Artomyces pyxidatus]
MPNFLFLLGMLLYSSSCLTLSLLLRQPIFSHTLRIAKLSIHITPPSIKFHDVHVTFPDKSIYPSTKIAFKGLELVPSIPTRQSPFYFTIILTSALLVSQLSTVSTTQLTTSLLLLPVLSHMSAGPPAQVTIEGFRLRIFSSTRTPHLVQRLRQALVSTLLFGEWLRCDDAAVQVTFGKDFVGRSENFDGPGADALGAPIGDSQARADADDDLTVTSTAANLHVHDRKGRIYAFRAVGACLRRTWGAFDGARGAYEMEAEGAQWRRFPPAVLGAAGLKTRNPWRCVFSCLCRMRCR